MLKEREGRNAHLMSPLGILTLSLLAPIAWYFVGGIILICVDEDEKMMRWLEECPSPNLRILVIMAWPYLVYKRYTD